MIGPMPVFLPHKGRGHDGHPPWQNASKSLSSIHAANGRCLSSIAHERRGAVRTHPSAVGQESCRTADDEREGTSEYPGPSYHITVNLPGIEHFSFTDEPLITAKTKQGADRAAETLTVLNDYTRGFFDRYLKNASTR